MGLFSRTKSMVGVALLVAVFVTGVFPFLLERVLRLNRSSAELLTAIEEAGERDKSLRAIQGLLTELQTEEDALNGRFVGQDGVVSFIELLERSARDAKVSMEVVSVAIEPSDEQNISYEWLELALSAGGSWQELFHLLVLFESLPFAVKVEQVAFTYRERPEVAEEAPWEGKFVVTAAKLKGISP